ncbi:MAG TPA: histidine kinase [Leptospiraceae bacterium]|nr:histidine kinase [Spirochaetaceae bacterium]HBS06786.1 histidine kinase [Leptospiraceae bacterium]|tara:strand:- start:5344 stop:5913 length:570 start_codon:yes stop_codon:yes gene_type:complete
MFQPFRKTQNTRADYEQLLKSLDSLLEKPEESAQPHFFASRSLYGPGALSTLANAIALLHWFLDDVNWCGFYLWDGQKLVLGPFQGMPACTVIDSGKGVCGSCFERRKPVIVDDVNRFPGHIACDPASRSEIVVPLFAPGTPPPSPDSTHVTAQPIGVLDVDSPEEGRFDTTDSYYLERFTRIVADRLG